jgi:pimeloyl-ACP methyl ester carboxylesterase
VKGSPRPVARRTGKLGSCVLTSFLVLGTAATWGPVAGAGAASTAAAPSTLAWHACDAHYLCSTLDVPLNYAQPNGAQVKLAVVELASSSKSPIGDLVMNPGGPGGSGVQFLEGQGFPAALRSSFNLVSFDPRGVNESDPVKCVGSAKLRQLAAADPDPVTASQVQAVVDGTKQFDDACAANTSKELLQNVSTLDTARDLDRLRAALGQAELTYMGFSYGTYLGEVYAEHFPSHIRAMVLDGVVNPALSVATESAQQAEGFEFDLNVFFSWCGTNPTCNGELPQGAAHAYQQLMAELSGGSDLMAHLKPMYGGNQRVTLGLAETAVLGSLYTKQTWSYLAQAIAQGLEGDGSLLAALAYSYDGLQANGTFANLDAANSAINCLDRPYPKQVSYYQALASRLAKVAPYFGALSAWSDLGCAFWPIPAQGKVAPVNVKGAPPMLLIGSTGDPATPYPWAQEVARQIPRSRLLTRDGPGHTGYLYSKCVQKWADQYLATLALPPAGAVCKSGT